MHNQHYANRQHSFLRLLLVGLMLSVTLAVSVASRATVVKADSGEAAFGTSTQALESAISLGDYFTCIINNGNVLCWGDNNRFQ
jgi:thiamine pyrophosphate-dependent acetolactate synthase large subunit-like protein